MLKRRIRVERGDRRRRIREPRRAAKEGSAWVGGEKQQRENFVVKKRWDPEAVGASAGSWPVPLKDEGCGLEEK